MIERKLPAKARDEFALHLKAAGYHPKTVSAYIRATERWLESGTPLHEVQQWVNQLSLSGLRPPTVHKHWAGVRQFVLLLGAKWLGVSQFPAVRLPADRNPGSFGYLSEAEIAQVIEKLPPRSWSFHRQRLRTAFYLLYGTGMRLGEALRARWKDWNLHEGRLYIDSQKSGRGGFYVDILPIVHDELEALHDFGPRSDWILGSSHGNASQERAIRRPLSQLLKSVNERATLHALRASFATHLIQAGTPLPHVQQLMRHKNLAATQRYLHIARSEAEAQLRAKHPLAKGLGKG